MEEQNEFKPFTKPQGRPKLADKDKRSERVTIKYSTLELEKVTELSAKYGKPLRTYIRELSIKDTKKMAHSKAFVPEINRKTLMELNRIGVNMNQIIKAINQGRTIFQKEIEEELLDLRKEINEILALLNT
jgi:predicted DNA binding CopG/RHH family protein